MLQAIVATLMASFPATSDSFLYVSEGASPKSAMPSEVGPTIERRHINASSSAAAAHDHASRR
jgi:hypothetical protein